MTSPLSVAQRLDWLEARIDELRSWLDREWLDLDAWTFDGQPLALGARWPDRAGVHRLEHPEVELPWIYSLLPHPGGWLEGGVLAEAADLPDGWAADLLER